jgi:hypothetical protein
MPTCQKTKKNIKPPQGTRRASKAVVKEMSGEE